MIKTPGCNGRQPLAVESFQKISVTFKTEKYTFGAKTEKVKTQGLCFEWSDFVWTCVCVIWLHTFTETLVKSDYGTTMGGKVPPEKGAILLFRLSVHVQHAQYIASRYTKAKRCCGQRTRCVSAEGHCEGRKSTKHHHCGMEDCVSCSECRLMSLVSLKFWISKSSILEHRALLVQERQRALCVWHMKCWERN